MHSKHIANQTSTLPDRGLFETLRYILALLLLRGLATQDDIRALKELLFYDRPLPNESRRVA